mgnify:CR=1 FL=1
MKQWIKYVGVILIFAVMVGYFLPYSKVEVNASIAKLISENSISSLSNNSDVEDVTVSENETSIWSVIVQYNLNGGSDAAGVFVQTEYTADLTSAGYSEDIYAYIPEEAPQRTGYIFGGWSCNISDFGEVCEPGIELYFTRSAHSGATITFTAIWNAVTVSYDEGNGTNYSVIITNENVDEKNCFSITLPEEAPVRVNHRFLGWLCSVNNKKYGAGNIVEDGFVWNEYAGKTIEFIAQWEKLPQVTVSYVSGNDVLETVDIQQVSENDLTFDLTLRSELAEYAYHKFTGWLCNVDQEIYEPGSTVEGLSWETYGNGKITFTAQWEELPSVTIEYVNGDESVSIEKIQQPEESATSFLVTIPEDVPVYIGHEFNGWLCDADNGIYMAGDVVKDLSWEKYGKKTITFTAQWKWNNYSILEAGAYYLVAGKEYCLGEGTWTVNNDGYSYAGGSIFCVNQDGNYIFNVE